MSRSTQRPPRGARSRLRAARRAALIGAGLAAVVAPTADARSILHIGILRSDGVVFSKHDGIGAPWRYEVAEAKNIALDGRGSVSFVRTDGAHWNKQLGQDWEALNTDVPSTRAVAGGGYLGVINTQKQFRARATVLNGQPFQLTMQAGAVDASLSSNRVGVVLDNQQLYTKEGGLGAGWVFQLGGALDTEVTNNRIAARLNNNELWVKEGSQYDQWQLIATDASSFSLDGNRIAYINQSKQLFVKEGGVQAPWVFEVGGAVQGDLAGDVIGALLDNGEVWAKQGGLGAPWQNVLQRDGVAIDFSNYEAADPPAPAFDVDAFIRSFRATTEAEAVRLYGMLSQADRDAVDARLASTTAEGRLHRAAGQPAVYLFENGAKSWITSPEAATDWGYDLGSQLRTTAGALARLANSENIDPVTTSAVDAPTSDDLGQAAEEEDPELAIPAGTVKVDKTYKCTRSGSVRNAPRALAIGWCVSKATEAKNTRVKQGYFTATFARPSIGMYNGWISGNLTSCGRLLTSHALGDRPTTAPSRWGHNCGSKGLKETDFAKLIADVECVNDEQIINDSNPFGPSQCRTEGWKMTRDEPGQYVRVKAGKSCPRYMNVNLTSTEKIAYDPIRDPSKSTDTTFVQETIPDSPTASNPNYNRVLWRYLSKNGHWVMAQWVNGSHNWAFIPADCVDQPQEIQWMTKNRDARPTAKEAQIRVLRPAQPRPSRIRR